MDPGLDAFINPNSVAVIGASERLGSWGSFIMTGLTSLNYPGVIYPVNPGVEAVYGIPTVKDIREIHGPVDLAVVIVPEKVLEETVLACGQKGVKGLTIITAGFGETSSKGQSRQNDLADLARSLGMRILGPNVSGTFNLPGGFNASATPANNLRSTPLAAICQGGYAFYDMLSAGWSRNIGVGKFIHTGNECDLTVTDFLEKLGMDREVQGLIMYIEAIRDGRRFFQVAGRVAAQKPVVVYKAGRTIGSARAAHSHTGALAGKKEIYEGLFRQVGVIPCPEMELLLPLGHALIERPPLRGRRIGIITMGGSWGVALTDALEEAGLSVPEFSPALRQALRNLGLPERASTRNPVDFGASGLFLVRDLPRNLGLTILTSGEVDGLVIHGLGRPGQVDRDMPEIWQAFLQLEKEQITGVQNLEKELAKPVIIGSHYQPWESPTIHDLNQAGIRIYTRLSEIARVLSLIYEYWQRPGRTGV